MSASPFSPGTKILGGAAAVLLTLIAVGVILPSTWEAEASSLVDAPPEAAFTYLDSPEGWRRWTVWPEEGVEVTGPARGAGASFSWNHPELGSGAFTIVEALTPTMLRYRVEVNDGSMLTDGVIRLAAEGGGTRMEWRESGDLGRNPLMGYWARSMDRAQSAELQKSLDRLAGLLSDSTGSEPSR